MKKELRTKLSALGSEGALDVLIYLKEHGWSTASDLAEGMDTHVATAVKRLSLLHDAGFLKRRVRKGKTRSAQEYSIHSTKISLLIDLEDGKLQDAGNATFYSALLRDILARLGRFGGRNAEKVLQDWKSIDGMDEGILTWLENGTESYPHSLKLHDAINIVLNAEAVEYGELTVKALARASLDAVVSMHGSVPHGLPERFFGGN